MTLFPGRVVQALSVIVSTVMNSAGKPVQISFKKLNNEVVHLRFKKMMVEEDGSVIIQADLAERSHIYWSNAVIKVTSKESTLNLIEKMRTSRRSSQTVKEPKAQVTVKEKGKASTTRVVRAETSKRDLPSINWKPHKS